ncbi:MAG: nuclear transport factor 2 family protein [Bacteroidia bacterium]
MSKITIQADCGNAPRKIFLKEFYSSLFIGDTALLDDYFPENICWQIAGQDAVTGKKEVLKAFSKHKLIKAKELTIETIITHGREAAVSGHFKGKDNLKHLFCDVFRFKGAGGISISSVLTFIA